MSSLVSKKARTGLIAELRSRIAGFEASRVSLGNGEDGPCAITTGAGALDAGLPGGGLARGALHEVRAASYRDMSAGAGFAVAMAVRCARAFVDAPVLWCENTRPPFDMGRLYGPGLAAFGLDPARLVLVSPASDIDLLWTMEEALRLGAFAAVVGEIDGRAHALSLTATRRLQLAAEENGRPALLLTGHASMGASAAATRWCVTSAPSAPVENVPGLAPFIGRARWQLRLEKCRNIEASAAAAMFERDWLVEWDVHAQSFVDAPKAAMSDPLQPGVRLAV